jgi:type IV secretion system protein TrbF
MTTAVLTPEKKIVSSQRETPQKELTAEQQAALLAEQHAANPFLDTRRAWNGVWEESLASARRWRLIALFEAALLALALFGLIHLGSQPKAIPYVVEVNKLGEVAYSGRLEPAGADSNVIKASIASFISDLRMVTPDAGLQAEAINRVYAYISKGDPALGRVNSFYGATKESSPYVRAVDEIVSVQIDDVLPTSQNSWQVDWTETTRDRKGEKAVTAKWRGLVTIVLVPPSASTSEAQLRRNPLGVYVQDVTWSRLD